jgi:hypothetical protein
MTIKHEVNFYASSETASHRTLHETELESVPVVGDMVCWDESRADGSSKGKFWEVVARFLHQTPEGEYWDLLVAPARHYAIDNGLIKP